MADSSNFHANHRSRLGLSREIMTPRIDNPPLPSLGGQQGSPLWFHERVLVESELVETIITSSPSIICFYDGRVLLEGLPANLFALYHNEILHTPTIESVPGGICADQCWRPPPESVAVWVPEYG